MRRRHEVTAVLRDPTRVTVLPSAVTIRTGNAANAGDVAELSVGQDLVITATRPAPGSERDLVATVEALLAGLRLTGVRVPHFLRSATGEIWPLVNRLPYSQNHGTAFVFDAY